MSVPERVGAAVGCALVSGEAGGKRETFPAGCAPKETSLEV